MPLPTPHSGEQEQDFVSRVMGDENAQKEFPKQFVRLGYAYGTWRREHPSAKNMSLAINHGTLGRVHSALSDNNVDYGEWSTPAGSERKKADCLAIDRQRHIFNEHGQVCRECHYPVFTSSGKLSAKGLASASGYSEHDLPALHKLIAPLLEELHEEEKKKEMSLAVDKDDKGIFRMSLIGGELEDAAPSDLFYPTGDPFPKSILGEPCFYAWKDLSIIGNWQTGKGDDFPVGMARENHWIEMYELMSKNGVKVPIVDDHGVEADKQNGWLMKLRVKDGRLQALMQLIGDDSRRKAAKNDVSVGVDPMLIDGARRVYPDAIQHIGLTPLPCIPGLRPAVLAASRAADGASATTQSAENPNHGGKPMATTLTDGHVGALRKHAHLAMSNIPDDKIGDHLVSHHDAHAEHLKQMCMAMPGGADCPPEQAMSRAVQHVKTTGHILGRLMPKNMSLATVKPDELASTLDARLDVLSKAGEQLDGLTATIDRQNKEIQVMSRQIPANPFPTEDSETTAIETMSMGFDQLSGNDGKGFAQFFIDGLKKILISADGKKANVACMSRAANLNGSRSLAVEVLDLCRRYLEIGPVPKAGEKSRLQAMSRQVPGQTGPTPEQDAEALKIMKRGMGVPQNA